MSEATIVGYCRSCGKALDHDTVRNSAGTIYCAEHLPLVINAAAPPPLLPASAPPRPTKAYTSSSSNSPALAFILGFIPGVGAVYNAQSAKGLVHVLIFGLLISIVSNGAAPGFEPLFGILIACFAFYMPFEAYHTAKNRAEGQSVDEFSSLFPFQGSPLRFPIVAILLIVFGVLFLLSNLDLLDFHARELFIANDEPQVGKRLLRAAKSKAAFLERGFRFA